MVVSWGDNPLEAWTLPEYALDGAVWRTFHMEPSSESIAKTSIRPSPLQAAVTNPESLAPLGGPWSCQPDQPLLQLICPIR
jgi:hypothetical protein